VFVDADLAETALRHRSYVQEHGGESNERLEFLGDAVLDLVVTDVTFRAYPQLSEGVLTNVRKGVVSTESLARIASDLQLGKWLLLGRGEESSGGRGKPALLADTFEALLGAIYVDGGLQAAQEFVSLHLGLAIEVEVAAPGHGDAKSVLQEFAAAVGRGVPVYSVEGSGPDHERTFEAVVSLDGAEVGRGRGRSKKAAEQAAARAALEERGDA
jgi:ribonuclease-3